jgi:putative two-component system response regulator
MEEGRGVFFEPALLDLFLNNIDDFVEIRESLKDQQEELIDLEGIKSMSEPML